MTKLGWFTTARLHYRNFKQRAVKSRHTHNNEDVHLVRRNVGLLYAVYASGYLVSFLTLPYLARTLGPRGFGILAGAQAYAWCGQMWTEFGFNFSAAKAGQALRHETAAFGHLAADVLLAKCCLFAGFVLLAMTIGRSLIPGADSDSLLLVGMLLFAGGQGFSPIWAFQATGRMGTFAVVDLLVRSVSALLIVLLVHTPQHAGLALTIQGGATVVTAGLLLGDLQRKYPMRATTWHSVAERVKAGAGLFAYRLTTSVQLYVNPLLLSTVAAPVYVGYFSGAERIAKFLFGLVLPFGEGLYPYLSRQFDTRPESALRIFQTVMLIMLLATTLISVCLFAAAPLLIQITLGNGFEQAVYVLRILSVYPVLGGLSNIVGLQFMIPSGKAQLYNTIVLFCLVAHIVLGLALAVQYQHIGMAVSVIATQALALFLMLFRLRREVLTSAPWRMAGSMS